MEKCELDSWVVKEVVDTLYMAKTTLLGITGLDSERVIAEKSIKNETAITRRISSAINLIEQSKNQQ